MAEITLNQYLKKFESMWDKSLDKRTEACEVYADAVDTYDNAAKREFRRLELFKNWSYEQWRLAYLVGEGILLGDWLDFVTITVPLSMARHHVSIDRQIDIHDNGLQAYSLSGRQHIIRTRALTVGDIDLVFKEDGSERSKEEQIQVLAERQRPNFTIMADGQIRVGHGCYINRPTLIALLTKGPYHPLTSQELRDCAAHNDAAQARALAKKEID